MGVRMSWVEREDLVVGKVYEVDLNGGVNGEFSSRLITIVPDGDGYGGHLEFENGVTLDINGLCRFWEAEDQ